MRTFIATLLAFLGPNRVAAKSQIPYSGDSPSVNLRFNDNFSIDRLKIANRDPAKPLYFNIAALDGPEASQYYTFTADIETEFQVWLDGHAPPSRTGSHDRSLAMRITASKNVNVKDKIVFAAVHHRSRQSINIAAADNKRFLSFDFMLDKDYEIPNGWLLHLQAFQLCGHHPPFSIHVTPGHNKLGDVEFTFNVIDDALEASQFGKPKIIYKIQVKRAVWSNMTLALKPRFNGSAETGEVTMWWNGTVKFTYKGDWGYRPASQCPLNDTSTANLMGIDIGIYRRRQATTQLIYIDNIKYGTSLASVLSLKSRDR